MDTLVRALNALLMIALPLILAVWLVRRLQAEWRFFFIGAGVFVFSQVLHLPFNFLVLNPLLVRLGLTVPEDGLPLLYFALIFGFSAGIFEGLSRYIGFRFWAKDARDWQSGLMVGAGHGGVEAIFLGILALYALIQILALGGKELATVLPLEQVAFAQTQIDAYWALPWPMALMGAVERISALCLHLSASLLILQAFRRKNGWWILTGIVWHALFDAVAVYAVRVWGVYPTELILFVMAGFAVGLIFLLRDQPGVEIPPDEPRPPQSESAEPVLSVENLEESKFSG